MRKLIKKILAPIVRELIKEEMVENEKSTTDRMSQSVLETLNRKLHEASALLT